MKSYLVTAKTWNKNVVFEAVIKNSPDADYAKGIVETYFDKRQIKSWEVKEVKA